MAGLHRAADPAAFREAVDAWIPDVWQAWTALHPLARTWLDHSIDHPPVRRRRPA